MKKEGFRFLTLDNQSLSNFFYQTNNLELKDGKYLYFSQHNKISSYDLRKENDKKIYSEKDFSNFQIIRKNLDEYPEENFFNLGEINDFDVSNGNLIWNDQEKDKFYICNLSTQTEENLIDIFTLSSAFTQTFTKRDECILCSFEGNFIKYNFKDKKIKAEKNVKNYLLKEMKENYGNYMTNPPFINKCLFNRFSDEVYFALMNGVVLSLKNNLKTKFVKTIHNGAIRDLRLFNQEGLNDIILTLGKDKCIKAFDSNGEVRLCVDLAHFENEDAFAVESNLNGDIYYLDENSTNLKIIKSKT